MLQQWKLYSLNSVVYLPRQPYSEAMAKLNEKDFDL